LAFPIETDKKAAKVVTPSLLRAHNAALSLAPSGTYSSPRLRLHSVAAFFFSVFSFGKCSFGQAGEKRNKQNGLPN
jgi:hypothetical protein